MSLPRTTPPATPVEAFGRLSGSEVDAWASLDVWERVKRELQAAQDGNARIAAECGDAARRTAEVWVDALQFALDVIRDEAAR